MKLFDQKDLFSGNRKRKLDLRADYKQSLWFISFHNRDFYLMAFERTKRQ